MATPDPLNSVTSRFQAREVKDGYLLNYIVTRGPAVEGIQSRWTIKLRDRRSDKSTRMPVSWSFRPAHVLPPFDDVYGAKADAARAERKLKKLGNYFAGPFTSRPPFDMGVIARRRDFDTIIVYAGPGVSVEPDKQIRETLPGGSRAADFADGMVPGYTPFVEIIRVQSPERVPQLGEFVDSTSLMASYVESSDDLTEAMVPIYQELAAYLTDFPKTTENMTVREFRREIEIPDDWFEAYYGSLDPDSTFGFVREDAPFLYAVLYLEAHFRITNKLLLGDEVKHTPMPWGLRLTHLKSMISVTIRVPVVAADPHFAIERRELTLGRQVVNRGDVFNHSGKFVVRVDTDALLARGFEWEPVPFTEFGGAMTEEELAEEEAAAEALNEGGVLAGPFIWAPTQGDKESDPPIVIVKTPSVNVTLQSPALAQVLANFDDYAEGGVDRSYRGELDLVTESNLVACYEVDHIDDVPDPGVPFSTNGMRKLDLLGQRDEAELLSDELVADLVDGGMRLAPWYGDLVDLVEFGYGLYAGRDLHGRKVTQEELLLMGLALLPVVNGGIIKAGLKIPKSLARALSVGSKGAMVGGGALLARGIYDVWDVLDFESLPETTAEFF